jgi:hypothetical protein
MLTRRLMQVGLVVAAVLMSITLPAVPVHAQACEYWVAPRPAGNDANPGTFALPWATLEHAANAVPDRYCTIWFKDGIYEGAQYSDRRFETRVTFRAVNPYSAILQYAGIALEVHGGSQMWFEGFQFSHSGPTTASTVVEVQQGGGLWAEHIVFRNNIFHDAYSKDLLRVHNGARFVTIENNLFYNQASNEQHMDVNSVTDVAIQDNIYFNDFAGSGRVNANDTKAFIVVKDSNGAADGLEGSERVAIRRNIFLNWEGGRGEPFIQLGNDGKPYHEAKNIQVENNLMLGNAPNQASTILAVSGGRDITFVNNTVVGDLPSAAYAFRITQKGSNPRNQNLFFYNNIWSDPTGTMGADSSGAPNDFSDGDPAEVMNLILDNNLYWNGGAAIPAGDQVHPLTDDAHRVVADPRLNTDQAAVVLPRWNGSAFRSGSASIRQEFQRLVELYGQIPVNSPAAGRANPSFAPAEDILKRSRLASPSLGAYQWGITLAGYSDLTTIWLNWSDARVPNAASLAISYTTAAASQLVTGIPTPTQAYTLTGLLPYSLYAITLTVRDAGNAILTQSNTLNMLTTDRHAYLPIVLRNAPEEY